LTLSGVLVIGNHPKLFKKREKNPKKKSSDFFKIKIIFGNSYASFPKMLKFLKNSNFLPKFLAKQLIAKSIAKYCYSSFNSLF
jgi:hypothetical protein